MHGGGYIHDERNILLTQEETDNAVRRFATVEVSSPARTARLLVIDGPDQGRAFPLSGDSALLGRSRTASVMIAHAGVSREHARIWRTPSGEHEIEDLGSRNGTLVNGRPVQRCMLTFGDRVQLGSECTLLYTYIDSGEQKLEHLRRMEVVGQLAAGVAHDFNNLLHVIRASFTHLAELDLDGSGSTMEVLADGMDATRQAEALTRRLLSLGRPAAGTDEPVSIADAVEETARLFTRLVGQSVSLKVSVAPGLSIWGNTAEMQQVLMNLCVNARDAMPGGGVLRIHAVRDGSDAVLTVTDTGVGMSEETRSRVFEPFFTTKAASRGTGLGLATTFAIVRRRGGTIEVASTPGQGTTFTIRLPAHERSRLFRETRDGSDFEEADAPVSGLSLLLLEDDPLVLRALVRQVSALGCECTPCSDGATAIERARDSTVAVDIALVDFHLGSASVLEIIPALIAARPGVPILVLSGFCSPEEEAELLSAGVREIIAKPCPRSFLADRIGAAAR